MQNHPTPEDVAWAAGLFEGEGFWAVYRRSGDSNPRNLSVKTKLASTDRDVVERFLNIVDFGAVRVVERPAKEHKTQYHWESGRREDIKRMARMFLPHLGSRRAQRAREILDVPPPRGRGPAR